MLKTKDLWKSQWKAKKDKKWVLALRISHNFGVLIQIISNSQKQMWVDSTFTGVVHRWFKLELCNYVLWSLFKKVFPNIPNQPSTPRHWYFTYQKISLVFLCLLQSNFWDQTKNPPKKHLKKTDPNPSYSQFPEWRSWNFLDFALKRFQFNFKEPKIQIQRQFLSSFFSLHVPMGFSYIAQLQLFQMRATWWLLPPVPVDWLGGGKFLSLIFYIIRYSQLFFVREHTFCDL